jgi:hypothetical protein
MNLIAPHIHRIRELSINVMFSSSLPSILTDFHGTATMMFKLELHCREDDGGPDRRAFDALTAREEFRCPKLKYLTIDGRNCYEACRSDPQWTKGIANVVRMTISHFHPHPGESFSPHELLPPLYAISNLGLLRITDLDPHPSPEPLDIPDLDPPMGEFLDLEDLHGFKVMDQIIRFLDNPFNISFTHCTFDDITDEFNYFADHGGGVLNLEEISQDLTPLLRLWHGHSLKITDCPRFDDALLDAMSSNDNGLFNCAAYVERVNIHDCPNFSIAALRRFVESRLNLPVSNDDPWNYVIPRIQSIRCSGNVPSISSVEKAWFGANLVTAFSY